MAIQTAEFGPLNSKWAIPSPSSYIQTGTKLRKEHSMIMRLDHLRASSQNSGNIGKLLQDVESWFRFVAIYA
jgi:hypothetical protein